MLTGTGKEIKKRRIYRLQLPAHAGMGKARKGAKVEERLTAPSQRRVGPDGENEGGEEDWEPHERGGRRHRRHGRRLAARVFPPGEGRRDDDWCGGD